jgi:hypothetical protein
MRQPYAAVDGAVLDLAAGRFAQNNRAGAAVAFTAALLGAGAIKVLAKDLKQGSGGWYIADGNKLAPPDEADGFE